MIASLKPNDLIRVLVDALAHSLGVDSTDRAALVEANKKNQTLTDQLSQAIADRDAAKAATAAQPDLGAPLDQSTVDKIGQLLDAATAADADNDTPPPDADHPTDAAPAGTAQPPAAATQAPAE